MGRLIAAFYDRMMAKSEAACLSEWRAELLRDVGGDVLEVGAGTGANLPYYPREVKTLTLTEPDLHMRRRLAVKAAALGWDRTRVTEGSLEHLPLDDSSVDVVVGTLVLCSVTDLRQALAEIHRVLRPQGRFIFLEHVAAEDRPRRLRWQRRIEPLWKFVSGNCHLTRRTGAAIEQAGFTLGSIKRESMRKAWPLVRPTIRGIAIKPGRTDEGANARESPTFASAT